MSKKNQANEHIQVFVRCRPLLKSELSVPVPVEVHSEVNKILVQLGGADRCRFFSFDKVFGPYAKQADIYAEVVSPIIQEVIMGFNCTIFAYGQTGTGKTFTIEGGRTPNIEDISEDPLSGIIPRSMKHLFSDLTEQYKKFEICVSFLELYNEEIFDLLSKTDDLIKLKIFNNSAQKGSVIVQGLEVRPVISMEEVYAILDAGFKKRRKAATLLNKSSSRSHTVFTVTVKLKESSSTFEKMKTGKLNLVDLAGSENIGRSGAIDKRAREAGNINQSLLTLGRVITSLCEKAGHIPYRESKLTRLLQDSLGGQTKTAIIATISPSAIHLEETLNTLEYALRAKNITNKPEQNAQVTATSVSKDYLEEINRLNREIYEWAKEKGFYVPEENVRHWELTLAAKKEENSKILSQIEKLRKEDEALDSAILEANNNLKERGNHLENAKLRHEEICKELEKEREDCKLHESMLQLMQPLHDHLHNKLHEDFEEKQKLYQEVMKMKEKLKSAVKEYRSLRENSERINESWAQRKKQFNLKANNLLNDIKNLFDTTNSLTSECTDYVSLLTKDFESASALCEKEFEKVTRAVSDLEAINESFQKHADSTLSEEKLTKLKFLEEFNDAYLTSAEFSILEPLNSTLEECESSLHRISSSLTEWKNHVSSGMNVCQSKMKKHLNNQKDILKSMTSCVEALLGEQKENFEMFNNTVAECISSETKVKKLWNDRFLSVDQALSTLDLFCLEHVENEVDKTTQAEKSLMNFSKLGKEITEKLTTYSKSYVENIDAVLKEIDTNELNAFSRKLEEMKKNFDTSCTKYKDLNSELAKFTSISKDSEGLSIYNDDLLKSKLKALDSSCSAPPHSQEKFDSILKCGDIYKAYLEENQSKIALLLSKDKEHVVKLTESSKLLSESFNKKVPVYINCIETDLQSSFAVEDIDMDENRADSTIKENENDAEKTITTSESLEESVHGSECPFCVNKISDKTLQADGGTSHAAAIAHCSKDTLKDLAEKMPNFEPKRSRSLLINCPQSPVRRPRGRNALSARRNLQFLDVEKLAYQLFERPSEEEP